MRFLLLTLWVFPNLFGFTISLNDLEKPKLYDCFLFYNELDILEIRLNELYDHIDYFVLVEAVETFRGKPKKLFFQENREIFQPFLDKIIHIVIEKNLETDDPWVREAVHRNQIMRGLEYCRPNDIILISDIDEVIRPSVLDEVQSRVFS